MDQQQILIRCRRQSQLDDPRPVGDVPIVPAGDFTTFAYDVIAEIQDADTGFDALRVLTTATSAGNLVSSLAVSHPVCTPNGDGISGQVELNYSLLQLVKPVGVEVGIYDLAGRRCAPASTPRAPAAPMRWPGTGRRPAAGGPTGALPRRGSGSHRTGNFRPHRQHGCGVLRKNRSR